MKDKINWFKTMFGDERRAIQGRKIPPVVCRSIPQEPGSSNDRDILLSAAMVTSEQYLVPKTSARHLFGFA